MASTCALTGSKLTLDQTAKRVKYRGLESGYFIRGQNYNFQRY